MLKHLIPVLLVGAMLLHAPARSAERGAFSFAVIAHPSDALQNDDELREAIEQTDAHNHAFVVVNGIKTADEPCSDKLYLRRKALLQGAKNGLIVSLAASDWAECKAENGKSAANGKLNRLRELFFTDDFSLGDSKLAVIRQSLTPQYRDFVENARWEINRIMFATINIPANNNHYVLDAGRNSEFEDRLVANREWLSRIFTTATRKKFSGIVLFSDGNPLATGSTTDQRDGYAETRRLLKALAVKFPGKVLIVHGASVPPAAPSRIQWQANLGELAAGGTWTKITVNRSGPALFTAAVNPVNDD